MDQNTLTTPFSLAFFFLLIIAFSACRKDDKDAQLTGYELKIVSGNHRTDSTNKQTTIPLIVAVYKDGKQLGRNDFYPYTVTLNNFVCGSEELSDYDVNIQADGTVHLLWFTGELAGTQRVVVTLRDDAGTSLAQTEASVDLTLNPDGWHAVCQKPSDAILATTGDRFLMFSQYKTWSSMDGKNWIEWGSSPGALDWVGSPDQKANLIYHKGITYAMYMNYLDHENVTLYRSADQGKTWTYESNYPKKTNLLAAIGEETLIVAFPNGISARTYKNGKYEKNEVLIRFGGFVDYVINGTYAFALDQFGGLYRAAGYNEQYVLVNEALKLEKILVKNNVLYGFSGSKAYHSVDNGTTFKSLGDIPQRDLNYNKVNDVIVAGNRFYIIQAKEASLFSMDNWVVSTSDWTTFSEHFLVRKNYYYPANFCVKDDGTMLMQKDNQFMFYKKP